MNRNLPLIPIKLEPIYQPRVWGGHRLSSGPEPIGEAWVVYEGGSVLSEPWQGQTLGALSAEAGEWLLGAAVVAQTGKRFPLLIKLLDTREWLSVQVHPNDDQAQRLEGPDQFGKTEAWHILEADEGAEIILGLTEETDRQRFIDAIQSGDTLNVIRRQTVRAGDTCLIQAGTVHALGPGIFLYEVQQTSDITYRVYDWDRPASAGRQLHIEQAIEVVDVPAAPTLTPVPESGANASRLTSSDYFQLERIQLKERASRQDTGATSFHALTVVSGGVVVRASGGAENLAIYESAIIPAAAGEYDIEPLGEATVLIARVA